MVGLMREPKRDLNVEMITSARIIRSDDNSYLIDTPQALPVSRIQGVRREAGRVFLIDDTGAEFGLFTDMPEKSPVSLLAPDSEDGDRRMETQRLIWH